ncbi:hypothetical protein FRC10_000947, partial [Ceratobasidium sp. 414]
LTFCFNIREDTQDDPEDHYEGGESDSGDSEAFVEGACVTVPRGMAKNLDRAFRCPMCLSKHPEIPIDYVINRGSRATQRMKVNADLVIIIASLPDLTARGKNIFDQIKSQLRAFEMNVTCYEIELPYVLANRDLAAILSSEFQYHLAFLFLTESNPGGGWWFQGTSGQPLHNGEGHAPGQAAEGHWLQAVLQPYNNISARAVSARIFGLCCGINLSSPGVVQDIAGGLNETKWASIVLPTAPSVIPEEYASMFPEMFMQLYYNTAPLKSALVKTWSRSTRSREHTDLLVIEYPGDPAKRTIQKFCYAPASSRPWGVDTPLARSFCNCVENDSEVRWVRRRGFRGTKFGEYFGTLHSSCKHTVLYVAVFAKDFRQVQISGTAIVVQPYSEQLKCFPLDSHERFRFEVAKVSPTLDFNHVVLHSPWFC